MNDVHTDIEELQSKPLSAVAGLARDLRTAAEHLSDAEARFLVDAYYIMQQQRLRNAAQVRSIGAGEPCDVLQHFFSQFGSLESQCKGALERYTRGHVVGGWMRQVKGIGPVISAGLLAHIDITKCPTAGHIFSFAGLDPKREWKKGEKRPWNAQLKCLAWKASESFVKTSGGKKPSHYGLIYAARKEQEIAKNEAGELAEQAALALEKKSFRAETQAKKAYESGKLPPAHIHARATRFAVKRFLSDLHCVWYFIHHGEAPALPYAIAHAGHGHAEFPPHLDVVPGLGDALEKAWRVSQGD